MCLDEGAWDEILEPSGPQVLLRGRKARAEETKTLDLDGRVKGQLTWRKKRRILLEHSGVQS